MQVLGEEYARQRGKWGPETGLCLVRLSPVLMRSEGRRVVEGKVRQAAGARSRREWKTTGEF